MSNVTTGVVAFSNLTEHEFFRGKTTGRFSLVVTMEPEEAAVVADKGVRVKDYKGKAQRKFSSAYTVRVKDIEDHPVEGEIPYGTTVRLLWKEGHPHPEWGTPTYLEEVRVVAPPPKEIPEEF